MTDIPLSDEQRVRYTELTASIANLEARREEFITALALNVMTREQLGRSRWTYDGHSLALVPGNDVAT